MNAIDRINLNIITYKVLVIWYILYKNNMDWIPYKNFNLLLKYQYKWINIIYSDIYFLVFKEKNNLFTLNFNKNKIIIDINLEVFNEEKFINSFGGIIESLNKELFKDLKVEGFNKYYFDNIFKNEIS